MTGLFWPPWYVAITHVKVTLLNKSQIVTLGVTINNIIGVYLAGIAQHEHYYTDPVAGPFPYPQELKPQGQVMFALQILHTCAMP